MNMREKWTLTSCGSAPLRPWLHDCVDAWHYGTNARATHALYWSEASMVGVPQRDHPEMIAYHARGLMFEFDAAPRSFSAWNRRRLLGMIRHHGAFLLRKAIASASAELEPASKDTLDG